MNDQPKKHPCEDCGRPTDAKWYAYDAWLCGDCFGKRRDAGMPRQDGIEQAKVYFSAECVGGPADGEQCCVRSDVDEFVIQSNTSRKPDGKPAAYRYRMRRLNGKDPIAIKSGRRWLVALDYVGVAVLSSGPFDGKIVDSPPTDR